MFVYALLEYRNRDYLEYLGTSGGVEMLQGCIDRFGAYFLWLLVALMRAGNFEGRVAPYRQQGELLDRWLQSPSDGRQKLTFHP